MNKRIKELAIGCGIDVDALEKSSAEDAMALDDFAKQIVLECMRISSSYSTVLQESGGVTLSNTDLNWNQGPLADLADSVIYCVPMEKVDPATCKAVTTALSRKLLR